MFADVADAAQVFAAYGVYVIKGRRVFGKQLWRLDLDDFPGRVFGGPQVKRLSHRFCNRAAGARVTNMIKAMRTPSKYNRW